MSLNKVQKKVYKEEINTPKEKVFVQHNIKAKKNKDSTVQAQS